MLNQQVQPVLHTGDAATRAPPNTSWDSESEIDDRAANASSGQPLAMVHADVPASWDSDSDIETVQAAAQPQRAHDLSASLPPRPLPARVTTLPARVSAIPPRMSELVSFGSDLSVRSSASGAASSAVQSAGGAAAGGSPTATGAASPFDSGMEGVGAKDANMGPVEAELGLVDAAAAVVGQGDSAALEQPPPAQASTQQLSGTHGAGEAISALNTGDAALMAAARADDLAGGGADENQPSEHSSDGGALLVQPQGNQAGPDAQSGPGSMQEHSSGRSSSHGSIVLVDSPSGAGSHVRPDAGSGDADAGEGVSGLHNTGGRGEVRLNKISSAISATSDLSSAHTVWEYETIDLGSGRISPCAADAALAAMAAAAEAEAAATGALMRVVSFAMPDRGYRYGALYLGLFACLRVVTVCCSVPWTLTRSA